jgi:probable HAF family extracellular repeat protein
MKTLKKDPSMKKFMVYLLQLWVGLLMGNACFAQMYTVTDLGTLGGFNYSFPRGGINAFGQVAGYSYPPAADEHELFFNHAFRTSPNKAIDPASDDLGTLGGFLSFALGINSFGQVVGNSTPTSSFNFSHAYRTAPNKPINPATDDLGTLGGSSSSAAGINLFGQVVGSASVSGDSATHAFRTRANRSINSRRDDLGTLGGSTSFATDINLFGQVVGVSSLTGDTTSHAFRTRANSRINPATDDLGTLGGTVSSAESINIFGQVIGSSTLPGDTTFHAFRTRPNRRINPATDDLGTLGGSSSEPLGINSFGQVVGDSTTVGDAALHGFLYSGGVMRDLNDLIPAGSGFELGFMTGINDVGEISGQAILLDSFGNTFCCHAVRLTPIYRATVHGPVKAGGATVFSAKSRRNVPVHFSLTQYNAQTCTLPPATITVTKAINKSVSEVDVPDTAFQVDPTACQYVYNLSPYRLGTGTYRIDLSIERIIVGSAVFSLR